MPVRQVKNPPDARGRDPDPAQVGTAMRELAMTAVGLAPLVEQRQDLRGLLGQQPMHGSAAGPPVDSSRT